MQTTQRPMVFVADRVRPGTPPSAPLRVSQQIPDAANQARWRRAARSLAEQPCDGPQRPQGVHFAQPRWRAPGHLPSCTEAPRFPMLLPLIISPRHAPAPSSSTQCTFPFAWREPPMHWPRLVWRQALGSMSSPIARAEFLPLVHLEPFGSIINLQHALCLSRDIRLNSALPASLQMCKRPQLIFPTKLRGVS